MRAKQVPAEDGGPGWWSEPVGQQRKSASHGEAGYERAERDFYPTEPWVTRALLNAVEFGEPGAPRVDVIIWEPACGDGRMARPLDYAGYRVFASDIHYYGWPDAANDLGREWPGGNEPLDFLRDAPPIVPDAIITNPPFDLAPEFIRKAIEHTADQFGKVAILQRHEFDAPRVNHPLFSRPYGCPFAAKLVLHKRPRWSDEDKASPRFAYSWYLWDWRYVGPPTIRFLPDPDKAPQEGLLL
jgi:hypothetical protein